MGIGRPQAESASVPHNEKNEVQADAGENDKSAHGGRGGESSGFNDVKESLLVLSRM
jgi:hypothetical protein